MAQRGSLGSGFRLDIQQIQLEAQHRWLRPAEICEILWNYKNFRITSEPPSQPPSGSLFLFDRNALRYFRKDGHNWRKKKDGKTVKEAHEKLKVGSVDMLHCYYAHGEENESFQRRSYWMLEKDSNIVFVHYLEVKGNKTNINHVKETEKALPNSPIDSPSPFSFSTSHNVSTSPTSTLTSTYEDTESEDNHQVSSRYNSLPGAPLGDSNIDAGYANWGQSIHQMDHLSPREGDRSGDSCHHSFVSKSQRTLNLTFWEEFLEHCTEDIQNEHSESLIHSNGNASKENILKPENGTVGQLVAAADDTYKQDLDSHLSGQACWQVAPEDHLSQFCEEPIDQKLSMDLIYGLGNSFTAHPSHNAKLLIYGQHEQGHVQQPHYTETRYINRPDTETGNHRVITSCPLLEDGLKKVDSFSRWIAKELGEVEELSMHSNSGISWSAIETGDVLGESSIINQFELETDSLNPSLCQDQLFSIIDFSPSWAYSNSETQVMITGTFLKSQEDVAKCNLSCMFGEVEVPAEILANGFLCCHAPPHRSGIVPFYITCSNRLACSEVREFEYRVERALYIDAENVNGNVTTDMLLSMRLESLLSLRSFDNPNCKENLISERHLSQSELEDQLYEQRLKGKFYSWLKDKVAEDGKGPNLLDKEGQGVLHLAAALGYNWALEPTIVAGVNIDFRDVNGWTALHWAAYSGREDTVAALVSLGAAPGVLTDPSPESPLGRTPADLASSNRHKGISGFLAESSLTAHLASLTMNESKGSNNLEMSSITAVQTVSERTASPIVAGDVPDALSLKDSLAAVCNATQAATRIHQIFRMQSLERKKFAEHHSDDIGSSGKHALTFKGARTSRLGQSDGTAHAAALCIQKKFRGWKKRKEFLLIRQRIVKIQAHVRGHQARKKHKPIIWSVGILEKVILRWRRKGSGLRGFRSVATVKDLNAQEMPSEEDDYDFLKHGRKQTEERLQKALNRVRSMVQYPEGRAQYRRILTTTNKLREIKDVSDGCLSSSEFAIGGDEDMIDIETLLDENTFLSMAFD